MIIRSEAVDAYLHREVDNYDWVRDLPDARLDRELREVGGTSDGLWRHQKECVLIGAYRPGMAYWLDMGTGKTRIALEVCKIRKVRKILVLVPFRLLKDSWARELEKWEPDFEVKVMTFASLRNKVCMYVRNKTKTRSQVVDKALARQFGDQFDATIVDESSLIGNVRSLIYKATLQVSKKHEVRIALSGTPFGRDPSLLWPQMTFVDHGESLGSWHLFTGVFFERGRWNNLIPIKKRMKHLHRLVGHRSVRIRVQDCMDMPERNYIRTEYEMPKKAKEIYKSLLGDLREAAIAMGKDRDRQAVESCFTRLCQATSGFLYLQEEESDREVLDLGMDARLEAAAEIALQTDEPFLIFSTFQASQKAILADFSKRSISHTTDPKKWQENGIQALVLPNSAGAFGGNFQKARLTIFYESPVSPMARKQAEARTWRAGQKRSVHYYDVVAKDGIDSHILGMLEQGKDLMDFILGGGEI